VVKVNWVKVIVMVVVAAATIIEAIDKDDE
jgi:hypothetical protein